MSYLKSLMKDIVDQFVCSEESSGSKGSSSSHNHYGGRFLNGGTKVVAESTVHGTRDRGRYLLFGKVFKSFFLLFFRKFFEFFRDASSLAGSFELLGTLFFSDLLFGLELTVLHGYETLEGFESFFILSNGDGGEDGNSSKLKHYYFNLKDYKLIFKAD